MRHIQNLTIPEREESQGAWAVKWAYGSKPTEFYSKRQALRFADRAAKDMAAAGNVVVYQIPSPVSR